MTESSEREVAVFSTARRLSAPARAAFLDEACGGNWALRQRVEELLSASEQAGDFLADPAPGAARPEPGSVPENPRTAASCSESVGDRIGRYKLLEQIGEGGCGVVYMAEQ